MMLFSQPKKLVLRTEFLYLDRFMQNYKDFSASHIAFIQTLYFCFFTELPLQERINCLILLLLDFLSPSSNSTFFFICETFCYEPDLS